MKILDVVEMTGVLVEDAGADFGLCSRNGIRTFREAGVVTFDKGFVLRFVDGSEFRVTVTQTRQGADQDGE